MNTVRSFTRITLLLSMALAVFATTGAMKGAAQAPEPNSCAVTWDLTAGQTIDVGTVTVWNDADNIYVKYSLDDPDYPNACFGELHTWVGTDLANVDDGGESRPSPGQLCRNLTNCEDGECVDATSLTEYTFIFPLANLCIDLDSCCVDGENTCGSLFVITHAEVDLDCTDSDDKHETAFGGDNDGEGDAWWFYGIYTPCCDGFGGDEIEECFDETAWGAGTRFNDNNWATYIVFNSANPSVVLYAGQNIPVGTVTIDPVADTVTFDVSDFDACTDFFEEGACTECRVYISEVHVNVGTVPVNKGGNPQIGRFDHVLEDLELEVVEVETTEDIVEDTIVAAHAVVQFCCTHELE